MTKRTCLFILAFWQGLSHATAQDLPLFAQYSEYHGLINPASVHVNFLTDNGQNLSFGFAHRLQWTGFGNDLSPSTKVVRGEFIDYKSKILWGGYIQDDRVGISQHLGIYGRFAYLIPIRKNILNGGFLIGFNIGTTRRQLRLNELPVAQRTDPSLLSEPSKFAFDIGFGVYYYIKWRGPSEYVYGGLSTPRLRDFGNNQWAVHTYGLLGIHIAPNNWGLWECSTWVRHVKSLPCQWSVNARYHLTSSALGGWLGGGLITGIGDKSDFTTECGVRIKAVKIGFAYTFSRSEFQTLFGNSTEINLAFIFDRRKK
jgi:type IX secretion system PorP/SprF family membrane protein